MMKEYDENGNLTYYKDGCGCDHWYEYDERGNQLHYKNSDGYEEWKEYNNNRNIINYRDSKGRWYSYEYNDMGYESHYIDNYGCVYWYEYDERGNEIHYRDVDGFESWYEYDERNNIIHYKDSNNYEEWREYDSKDRLIHSKDSDGCDARYYNENIFMRIFNIIKNKINGRKLTMETNYDSKQDTLKHIGEVQTNVFKLAKKLMSQGIDHDKSKLIEPEKSVYDEYTPKLRSTTYMSPEYGEHMKGMKKGLEHHYENNTHHPEHYENGMAGMDLIDLCELIADWYSACKRHADGDIMKSIETNQKRFGYSDEIKSILKNTVERHLLK